MELDVTWEKEEELEWLVRTASWVIKLLKGDNLKIFNEADFSADRPLREDEKLPILPEDMESRGSDLSMTWTVTWSTFDMVMIRDCGESDHSMWQ
ncbi:hypothetical protein V8E54_013430 [Elaphomyces granulatus]